MQYIIAADKDEMGKEASKIFAQQIKAKPNSVLGLATGSTPIPLYKELIALGAEDAIDFGDVRTVNLDEYIGLDSSHEQSYSYFMQQNLFNHININHENTVLPDGLTRDTQAECKRYDELITNWGGIDLQLLGLGHNGHIGFNEPGTEFILKTHVVEIARKTRTANSRFFGDDIAKVPKYAITMGIGNIMGAQKVLLMVAGADKAQIVKRALTGDVTPVVPASVLQLHKDVVVILDKDAAREFDMEML